MKADKAANSAYFQSPQGRRSRLWKRLGLVFVLMVSIGAVALFARKVAFAPTAPVFRFATVERGDLQATVSATGALQAVTAVSVGTQVSGQVAELLVDYNDEVKKGQLLARIDSTIARQAVADAQANLERLRAQTSQASREQDRNNALSNEGLIPKSTVEQGDSALRVARASEKSGLIALQRAQQNLSYTSIHAPIDGVVIERNVNLGQTVAASLQAPQLFLIANDLTRMQILALVGESDISQIQQGQAVTFTVQALQGQPFRGEVQQVRLQSTTVDNVVNYTVIIAVENKERKLLPGMTARVDFQVRSVENVLKVANAALRFRPSEEVLEEFGPLPSPLPRGGAEEAGPGPSPDGDRPADSTQEGRRRGFSREGRQGERRAATAPGASALGETRQGREGFGGRRSFGTLYSLGADGKLRVVRVRTGISDGISTEISGSQVSEGMKVIVGLASSPNQSPQRAAPNPLGGQQGGGRGRPGGGPF